MVFGECLSPPVRRSLSVAFQAPFSLAPLVVRGSPHSGSRPGSIPLRGFALSAWGRVLPASAGFAHTSLALSVAYGRLRSFLACVLSASALAVAPLRPPPRSSLARLWLVRSVLRLTLVWLLTVWFSLVRVVPSARATPLVFLTFGGRFLQTASPLSFLTAKLTCYSIFCG